MTMQLEQIRQFRTSLRKFERDAAISQKKDSRTGGLSVVQCHTIINLGEMKDTTLGQMADHMCVDKSTLSRTIDGLVKKELVDRIPDSRDRRFLIVKLSEKGKQVCDHLNRVNNDYIEQVFSRIPKQDHAMVIKYFNIFVKALLER